MGMGENKLWLKIRCWLESALQSSIGNRIIDICICPGPLDVNTLKFDYTYPDWRDKKQGHKVF